MPGTTVAPFISASLPNSADFAQVYYCTVCKKAISLSPNQTVQTIAQEVQRHIQKCMLSKGYTELNTEPVPDKSLAPVFALQPRRTWSAEDERRKRLEDDPDAYDVGPHSVTCAGCHRPIRLNATGRYYAANWNKHKMGCKTASSVSGWGAVTAESRFTGRVAAFRVTKPSENSDVLTQSPSSGTADRPNYSPPSSIPPEAYMGPSANAGAQGPPYEGYASERLARHPSTHELSHYSVEGSTAAHAAAVSHQAEDATSSPLGSSLQRYDSATTSDSSSSRKQTRPVFSTTPLPRLVQRDSAAYTEMKSQDDQKSIHALATALRRSRSDFSHASAATGSAAEPDYLPTPLQSPPQSGSPPRSAASDKGKDRRTEDDAALRSSTHTFHAQYRYTYPNFSPQDSPLRGGQSPFPKQSSPSVSPTERLRTMHPQEGEPEARYYDHRNSRSRFSPDTSSTTTSSSSSSGFSPHSAVTAYSQGQHLQADHGRSLPSLSSLSLQRNDRPAFRSPTIGRGSGDLSSYASKPVSLPPLGLRGDSESIVLPPIRDISTAGMAQGRDRTTATKHRLGEDENYDKEDSADHCRPSLPKLNTQPQRYPEIDFSPDRRESLNEYPSPMYTPSHSLAFPQRSTDPTLLRPRAGGPISSEASSSSDLHPSPRELSPASSDADAAASSAGRLHPVWKWEQTKDSPHLNVRDVTDIDVDMSDT